MLRKFVENELLMAIIVEKDSFFDYMNVSALHAVFQCHWDNPRNRILQWKYGHFISFN